MSYIKKSLKPINLSSGVKIKSHVLNSDKNWESYKVEELLNNDKTKFVSRTPKDSEEPKFVTLEFETALEIYAFGL